MKEFDELISSTRVEPKTYDPVKQRDKTAWFPTNEAASLVVQLRHIWNDLEVLCSIFHERNNEHEKKLILKYVVIEVRSLIEVFDKLQGIVMKAPTFDPSERSGWREITQEEKDKARILFKKYSQAKSDCGQLIIKIRNEIGAHRGNLNWQAVEQFWDSINVELVNPILDVFPEVFDYAKSLDLYDWSRLKENGNIEVLGSKLRLEYFHSGKET